MASEDTLRSKVSEILNSPACLRIRFRVDAVGIQTYMYSYIAQAVRENRVHIVIHNDKNPDGQKISKPERTAEYNPKTNTLLFRSADIYKDADGKATIVHEATHAVIDATHANGTVRSGQNELAAYLAQMLYSMYSNDKYNKVGPLAGPIYQLALKVFAFNSEHKSGLFVCDPNETYPLKVYLNDHGYQAWAKDLTDGIGDGPQLPPMRPD